jgi:hypothetical protein
VAGIQYRFNKTAFIKWQKSEKLQKLCHQRMPAAVGSYPLVLIHLLVSFFGKTINPKTKWLP